MITKEDAITAAGKYPDRLTHVECTEEVKNNLETLLEKINALLNELGIEKVEVTSGFRPAGVNAATQGSAKKSLHMQGRACDILDDTKQTLGNSIKNKPELLVKYGLWMESLDHTKGKFTNWVHLDCGVRKDRPIRIFIP